MNLPFFIAKRISHNKKNAFSAFIIRLATIATALSVAVMIIAVAVVSGFKTTIKEKMFSFWGHFQIAKFHPTPSQITTYDTLEHQEDLIRKIKSNKNILNISSYALSAAIISTEDINEGVIIKGVEKNYQENTQHAIEYQDSFINFEAENYAHQIVLSKSTLLQLNKKVGDTVLVYFIQQEQAYPRVRKLAISGSYHSGMEDIDRKYALSDIRLIRRVNAWSDNTVNGYQINIDNYILADTVAHNIYYEYIEPPLSVIPMTDIYPDIFNWIELQDINAQIILFIMAIVAVMNMATALLIFILERSNMIGILKSLGTQSSIIQKIFIYNALLIAIKGIAIGTLFGIIFCWIQKSFRLIKLNEKMYNMSYVPIEMNFIHILGINIGTLIFCFLILIIPTLIVHRISPMKVIKFD